MSHRTPLSTLVLSGLAAGLLMGAAGDGDSPAAHLWRGEFQRAQDKAATDPREKPAEAVYAAMAEAGDLLAKQKYADARRRFATAAKASGFTQVAGWWACETHRLAGELAAAKQCFDAAAIAPNAAMKKLSQLGRQRLASIGTGEVSLCTCQAYCSVLPIGPQVCQTMTWNAVSPKSCSNTRPMNCEY